MRVFHGRILGVICVSPLSRANCAAVATKVGGLQIKAGAQKSATSTTIVYGCSRNGRPLTAEILGDGPNVTLIVGGFHGNERATRPLVTHLLGWLASHPSSWGAKSCSVILAPCANPDGWKADTRRNARGVDLNRNFPEGWKPKGRAPRHNPGAAPASETETRGLMRLIKQRRPVKIISIHSPLHCLNWTGDASHQLAQAMSRCEHYPVTADIGYPTPGSFGLYCGRRLHLAMVTLELPHESAAAAWRQNREALLEVIRAL